MIHKGIAYIIEGKNNSAQQNELKKVIENLLIKYPEKAYDLSIVLE